MKPLADNSSFLLSTISPDDGAAGNTARPPAGATRASSGVFFLEVNMKHLLLSVAVVLSLSSAAWAYTTEASYYTRESCIKEGTSGFLTASGEVYNENQMSCASWDYPFGTRLKINHKGKSVIAVVNDRGPNRRLYKRGRKIDLSSAAFGALAPLSQGVIPVTVEVIK